MISRIVYYLSGQSISNLHAGHGRSSSLLTGPRVSLAAVAASNHVSIHLAPSHWNSRPCWPPDVLFKAAVRPAPLRVLAHYLLGAPESP